MKRANAIFALDPEGLSGGEMREEIHAICPISNEDVDRVVKHCAKTGEDAHSIAA